MSYFQDKVSSTQTAGVCTGASQDRNETPAQAVQRLRTANTTGPKVLVVCGDADADLASEMTHVSEFSQALQKAFESHVMAYVSDTSTQVNCTAI